jgi:hypothetical protein
MSHLQSKSNDLVKAAALLHNEKLFPAVAHCSYYCCVQQMKHILLHSLHKTERDLMEKRIKHNRQVRKGAELGAHEFLINEIGILIEAKNSADSRTFFNDIGKLKKLRVSADYLDSKFDEKQSHESLRISNKIVPILQKY